MDIIVNVYGDNKYFGRFKLTRTDKIVWEYMLGTALEIRNPAYPSLQKDIMRTHHSNDYQTYLDFEIADLDAIQ